MSWGSHDMIDLSSVPDLRSIIDNLKLYFGASERAQWVKALAMQPDGLNLIPKTHVKVEEEIQSVCVGMQAGMNIFSLYLPLSETLFKKQYLKVGLT